VFGWLVGLPVLMGGGGVGAAQFVLTLSITVNDLSERPAIVLKLGLFVPWLGRSDGFLILTFYSVIAGWPVAYFKSVLYRDFKEILRFGAAVMSW